MTVACLLAQAQGPAYQRIVMSIPRLKGRFVGTGAPGIAEKGCCLVFYWIGV